MHDIMQGAAVWWGLTLGAGLLRFGEWYKQVSDRYKVIGVHGESLAEGGDVGLEIGCREKASIILLLSPRALGYLQVKLRWMSFKRGGL